MNLRQYLLFSKVPQDVFRFCDFHEELKDNYKSLDGYAFDFNNEAISSIKLYHKVYNQKGIFNSNFYRWFTSGSLLKCNMDVFFKSKRNNLKSLSGLNFAVKYNLQTKRLVKSIYFSDKSKSSLVFNEVNGKLFINRYYYIHNPLLIKFINKLFKMNMPKHKEAIELSLRGSRVHCTVFPKLNRQNLNLENSSLHCQKLMHNLLDTGDCLLGQNPPLCIHLNTENSSLITKGYTSNNSMQKIYLGCFDWNKSIFSN